MLVVLVVTISATLSFFAGLGAGLLRSNGDIETLRAALLTIALIPAHLVWAHVMLKNKRALIMGRTLLSVVAISTTAWFGEPSDTFITYMFIATGVDLALVVLVDLWIRKVHQRVRLTTVIVGAAIGAYVFLGVATSTR